MDPKIFSGSIGWGKIIDGSAVDPFQDVFRRSRRAGDGDLEQRIEGFEIPDEAPAFLRAFSASRRIDRIALVWMNPMTFSPRPQKISRTSDDGDWPSEEVVNRRRLLRRSKGRKTVSIFRQLSNMLTQRFCRATRVYPERFAIFRSTPGRPRRNWIRTRSWTFLLDPDNFEFRLGRGT